MPGFVARRVISAVPLLLGVLTLIFLLVQAAPGDPFRLEAETSVGADPGDRLREIFGADRPLAARYVDWLTGLFSGDLGVSWSLRRPVAELLWRGLFATLRLAGLALALQFGCGIVLGALAARARGRFVDRLISSAAVGLYSTPSYWIGLLLVALLSVQLGWLPASQMRSVGADEWSAGARWVDALRHLLLPCVALALPTAGGVALFVRDQIDGALRRSWVRAARARGAGRTRAVVVHALRPSLLPVANLLGLALPALLGGSVVIETLFAWPGMGRLAHQAVLSRDEPLILGCVCVGSALVIGGSLLADLLAALLDPRAREGGR